MKLFSVTMLSLFGAGMAVMAGAAMLADESGRLPWGGRINSSCGGGCMVSTLLGLDGSTTSTSGGASCSGSMGSDGVSSGSACGGSSCGGCGLTSPNLFAAEYEAPADKQTDQLIALAPAGDGQADSTDTTENDEEQNDEEMTTANELDALRKKFMASAPAETIKTYEEGIETVRDTGIAAKAAKVGDEAPPFTLPNATGEEVSLGSLLEEGPVVITWYRGGWCPYCNIALRGFQRNLDELRDAGATFVAISPELPDKALTTTEKQELEFQVLSDAGNKVARDYGLVFQLPEPVVDAFRGRLDVPEYNGDDSWTLPLAATYVIDKDGVIRWAFVDVDYRKRAEPADVIAALRELK